MTSSSPCSLETFIGRVQASGCVSKARLDSFVKVSGTLNGNQLAERLIAAQALTKYQASLLLADKGDRLLLNDYVILNEIGSGGMGRVYRAVHRYMERIVAIKTLPPSHQRLSDAAARFRREAKVTARVIHPNVVIAFDAGICSGTYFLVLEYIDGLDLRRLLKIHGRLSIPQALNCIIQAARGLAAAHHSKILHRDVKPSNLLMRRDGVLKVLDLGLGRMNMLSDSGNREDSVITVVGQVLGTSDFMSPEQISNPNKVDARSDIYSLGCTLFALLTGLTVFADQSTVGKLASQQFREMPPLSNCLSDCPAALNEAYLKMVSKRQRDRPQSMDEVIAILSRHLNPRDDQRIDLPEIQQHEPDPQANRSDSFGENKPVVGDKTINTVTTRKRGILEQFKKDNHLNTEQFDAAYAKLESTFETAHTVVCFRLFAEFSHRQTAEFLGCSESEAVKHWHEARALLLSYVDAGKR